MCLPVDVGAGRRFRGRGSGDRWVCVRASIAEGGRLAGGGKKRSTGGFGIGKCEYKKGMGWMGSVLWHKEVETPRRREMEIGEQGVNGI